MSSSLFRFSTEDLELVATGGMATIYRVKQVHLDRHVAVKRIKDSYLNNPEIRERFRREARALASVMHQNVAHVYDFLDDGQEPFIVMEFIEGVDLSVVLERLGHLPVAVATAITLQVARGLGAMHANQLIHRDIKPSNIRLTSRGLVKLMDFGIVMDLEDTQLTRPGVMVGSPSYLSPEQILGDAVTPSTDIFLLGMVFYEMLTGQKPFQGAGKESTWQKIREANFTPVRQMSSKVPKEIETIVHRCLRKNPKERFASTDALVTALETALGPVYRNQSDKLIAKYLSDEAIFKGKVDLPLGADDLAKTFKPWWVAAAIGLMSFLLGWGVGSFSTSPPASVQGYPPPSFINK